MTDGAALDGHRDDGRSALLRAACDAALEQRYLWHGFGDSMLFLP